MAQRHLHQTLAASLAPLSNALKSFLPPRLQAPRPRPASRTLAFLSRTAPPWLREVEGLASLASLASPLSPFYLAHPPPYGSAQRGALELTQPASAPSPALWRPLSLCPLSQICIIKKPEAQLADRGLSWEEGRRS